MERLPKSELPIIGSHQFELTEKDVKRALKEAQENLEGTRQALSDPDERIRGFAERSISGAQRRAEALSSSPREVLARARALYDRTVELGSSGIEGDQLALQLGDEFPELMDFYGLLRMKPWGYHLGQDVAAAAAERRIGRRRGE